MKRPPDEVLRTWHRIISIRGGEVGVEVVYGEVNPCPAQRVRSAGLTRWVGYYQRHHVHMVKPNITIVTMIIFTLAGSVGCGVMVAKVLGGSLSCSRPTLNIIFTCFGGAELIKKVGGSKVSCLRSGKCSVLSLTLRCPREVLLLDHQVRARCRPGLAGP